MCPTSPRTLNSELFPQPLGPHTRTLVPDFTFTEPEEQYDVKRISKATLWSHIHLVNTRTTCEWLFEVKHLTSKLRSVIRTSPLGVAKGVCSNLLGKSDKSLSSSIRKDDNIHIPGKETYLMTLSLFITRPLPGTSVAVVSVEGDDHSQSD